MPTALKAAPSGPWTGQQGEATCLWLSGWMPMHANRSEGCTTDAMDGAAWNGHLSVVEWLHANRSEGCTTDAMDGAAWNGHLSVVEWLHANRTEGAMDWAAAAHLP
uniref:Uncharacterized protein n=1 Tax=Heterosigma akashiwo TaxID=2829 RepID=A0A7S3Y0I1_HETAK